MDFELQWLLIGLPVAFALGWLASRLDLRQARRDSRDAPRAYFKGLNLLLAEQQDKAIDAFIEAVQSDPDTTELHFALGNLFRRRGEFERAVRVHQHLIGRADLKAGDRDRAQYALAQDYLKAGLFDRAEQAYLALEGTSFENEARQDRLVLYERSRDWQRAAEVATQLGRAGLGSFAARIAHYGCELAQEAEARGDEAAAAAALQRAREADPGAPRALMMTGRQLARLGQPAHAVDTWDDLRMRHPSVFVLVAADYAEQALACGRREAAAAALREAFERAPGIDLLRALRRVEGDEGASEARLITLLQQQPTLSAAQELLAAGTTQSPAALRGVRDAVAHAARPLQRYRCAACGFESQRHFWQCPGCLSWDSFPPRRIEEQ